MVKENADYGPIFFYLYLISLNMILSNFFMSILDRSYAKVKSIINQNKENYSLKYVLCFCFFKKKILAKNGINIEKEFQEGYKFEVPISNKNRFQKAICIFISMFIFLMIFPVYN